MKRSNDFLLQDVAGTLVVVPVGEAAATFKGMITMNSTGAFLWELLGDEQTEQTLTEALVAKYEVEPAQARTDVEAFLGKLREVGAVKA